MTNLRQAAQQALEALEILDTVMQRSQRTESAITALKQALAEPEQPVAWIDPKHLEWLSKSPDNMTGAGLAARKPTNADMVPLYTSAPTPQSEQPLELTDEEIALLVGECAASAHRHDDFSFARAVIAAYERKNGITGEQT